MPPLETLADALVTSLLASDLTPAFVADWGYDNTYVLEDHKPADPVDVMFIPSEEDAELFTKVDQQGDFGIDIGIRAKIANTQRATVLPLREFADAVFYYWAEKSRRRLTGTDFVWTKTTILAPFVPSELRQKKLFFAVARLTFQGIR